MNFCMSSENHAVNRPQPKRSKTALSKNPTGQDPQFQIFCVPMEKSMDHADSQHKESKKCQQKWAFPTTDR